MSFYRQLLRRMSPAGEQGKLSILIFHRVLATPDPLFPDLPDATQFGDMLGWLSTWLNLVPLQQGIERLREGDLPERAAAITFDDGYADNHDVALPLLLEKGVSATFFIATGFMNGGLMWNDIIIEAVRGCSAPSLDLDEIGLETYTLGSTADRRNAIEHLLGRLKYLRVDERQSISRSIASIAGVSLPNQLMMSASKVRALHRSGMGIGAHTVSHPILAKLDADDATREIDASKRTLEHLLGEPVRLFAYPNGKPEIDFLRCHATMVEELGFDAALTTAHGAASVDTHPMTLPRFTPWERTRARFGARIALNLLTRVPAASSSPSCVRTTSVHSGS